MLVGGLAGVVGVVGVVGTVKELEGNGVIGSVERLFEGVELLTVDGVVVAVGSEVEILTVDTKV